MLEVDVKPTSLEVIRCNCQTVLNIHTFFPYHSVSVFLRVILYALHKVWNITNEVDISGLFAGMMDKVACGIHFFLTLLAGSIWICCSQHHHWSQPALKHCCCVISGAALFLMKLPTCCAQSSNSGTNVYQLRVSKVIWFWCHDTPIVDEAIHCDDALDTLFSWLTFVSEMVSAAVQCNFIESIPVRCSSYNLAKVSL